MQNPSRRTFFGGRTPELSLWEQCLLQLRHKTAAALHRLDERVEQAVFTVGDVADLHQALQLCHAFGVKLYLWGMPHDSEDIIDPVLWLDFSKLNQLTAVDSGHTHWFAQAGVTMAQLKAVGFDTLEGLPDTLSIANWLADSSYHGLEWSTLHQSGLVHASLLMADGSVGSLGAFGSQNTKPLNTPLLRAIIPQLFQLVSSPVVAPLLSQAQWLGRYRLDIFQAQNTDLNLAHLLLGHGGDLGMVEWVVLDQQQMKKTLPSKFVSLASPLQLTTAQEVDAVIKQLFDAEGLFSSTQIVNI